MKSSIEYGVLSIEQLMLNINAIYPLSFEPWTSGSFEYQLAVDSFKTIQHPLNFGLWTPKKFYINKLANLQICKLNSSGGLQSAVD